MSDRIHICYCVDSDYNTLRFMLTSMDSIRRTADCGDLFEFHIVFSDPCKIHRGWKELLVQFSTRTGWPVNTYNGGEVQKRLLSGTVGVMGSFRISDATFMRLIIPDVLPLCVRRVLYLDADTVICGSLSPWWNVDLGGKMMSMVPDYGIRRFRRQWGDCDGDPAHAFYAGQFVMDLDAARDWNLSAQARDYIEKKYPDGAPGFGKMNDQGIINSIVPYDSVVEAGIRYSVPITWMNGRPDTVRTVIINGIYGTSYRTLADVLEDAVILHYLDDKKKYAFGDRHIGSDLNNKWNDVLDFCRNGMSGSAKVVTCHCSDGNDFDMTFLMVSIDSIRRSAHPGDALEHHVVFENMSAVKPGYVSMLKRYAERTGCAVVVHDAHDIVRSSVPGVDGAKWRNLGSVMYLRAFLPGLLPDVDRIIYLDSDTIVYRSLRDLYSSDVGGVLLKSVVDYSMHFMYGVDKDSVAVQSGVMLMNLAEMRSRGFTEKFTAVLRRRLENGRTNDQEVFNELGAGEFSGMYGKLPVRYNVPAAAFAYGCSARNFSDATSYKEVTGLKEDRYDKPNVIPVLVDGVVRHYFGNKGRFVWNRPSVSGKIRARWSSLLKMCGM